MKKGFFTSLLVFILLVFVVISFNVIKKQTSYKSRASTNIKCGSISNELQCNANRKCEWITNTPKKPETIKLQIKTTPDIKVGMVMRRVFTLENTGKDEVKNIIISEKISTEFVSNPIIQEAYTEIYSCITDMEKVECNMSSLLPGKKNYLAYTLYAKKNGVADFSTSLKIDDSDETKNESVEIKEQNSSFKVVEKCSWRIKSPPSDSFNLTNLQTNVQYGPGNVFNNMDIAWPKEYGKYPLLLLIHGGGWHLGIKEQFSTNILQTLAEQNLAVATINYRLVNPDENNQIIPERNNNVFPAPISDVRCAFRYLRQNANSYNIDPDRIIALGQSAGGHLAYLLGLASDNDKLDDGSCPVDPSISVKVNAIIPYYGPTDLRFNTSSEAANLLGNSPISASEEAKSASPIVYVDKNDPMTLIVHCTADKIVPLQQSRNIAEKFEEKGVIYFLNEMPNLPHSFNAFKPKTRLELKATCTTLNFIKHVFD